MLLLCVCCLLFAHVITHVYDILYDLMLVFFRTVVYRFLFTFVYRLRARLRVLLIYFVQTSIFFLSLSLIHNRYLRSIPLAYEMCSPYCTFGQFLLSMKAHETAILLHIFLNVVNMFNQTQ